MSTAPAPARTESSPPTQSPTLPPTHPPQRPTRRQLVTSAILGVGAVATIVWVGLHVEPQPLPDAAVDAGATTTIPLPAGLPAPVERFYSELYGDHVPVVDTAVISGRGTMRIAGVTFPARWRFSHVTGQDYRHYIELTIFGRRVMAVNEWFLDGQARLELPVGVSQGPNIDQGANLALWAEAVWMPSVWVTDPAVRWEAIDATSARLVVPFGDSTETITVWFDPDTGLLERMESMRFKGETDEQRTRWINEVLAWGTVDGHPAPLETTITWGDDDSPWARLRTEAMVHNADLRAYVETGGT